jgi:disulfide bond formation protein DsbB
MAPSTTPLAALTKALTKGRLLWWAIFALGSSLLIAALYWQYVLGDDPCQVCIQARLWAVGMGLVGALMLMLPDTLLNRQAGFALTLSTGAGMGERAFYLYEIENFRGDGSCEFTLGMPSWFAVDQWFPALFEVRNICSYTPEIAFGVSMAEALIGIAAVVCVLALLGSGLLINSTLATKTN